MGKNYDMIIFREIVAYGSICVNVWRLSVMKMFITVLQVLCGLIVILAVLFQSGKSAGLSGAIGGVADSFLAKNKAKTLDAKLARATKWIGAVFLLLTLALLILG